MEIRKTFHDSLKEIQDDVLAMGSMVEKAISRSVEALKNRDLDMARQVIADDLKVNKKRFAIEEKCIELIARQQPMAVDLRTIICVLHVAGELERIGDYAEGTAKIVVMIGDEPPLKPLIDLPRMAEKTMDMLRRSLDAFIRHDAEAARGIVAEALVMGKVLRIEMKWTVSMTRSSGSCSPSWRRTRGPSPGPRASCGWDITWSAVRTG